jgi:hypothetical protein
VVLSELWKACALPWKLVAIDAGKRRSAVAFCTAETAAPIVAPGARLSRP